MLLLDVKNLIIVIIIIITINNNNNNNNNNEISSCNKNSTINKDNVISPSPSQISKETVFMLGDSMVKKLNAFH